MDQQPKLTQTVDKPTPRRTTPKVKINLSDTDHQEPFPDRILTLQAPEWSINVGRGSQSEKDLVPAPENAWFTARVMSRHHAVIRADPYGRTVTINDVGSMHGTFVSGAKLPQDQLEMILDGDVVTFGTEVVRGPDTYKPLRLAVTYSWSDELTTDPAKQTATPFYRNRFTADYSDEDDAYSIASSNDIEVVRESVRQPSIEILPGRPSSPPQSSQKSLDSPASDKHPSSITEPTDVSDDEGRDNQKKTAPVELVSIPSMLNPSDKQNAEDPPSDLINHDDTFTNNHMYDDDIDDEDFDDDAYDDYNDDDEHEHDENLCPDYPPTNQPNPAITSTATTGESNTGSALHHNSTTLKPVENLLREPDPSDAVLPKITNLPFPHPLLHPPPPPLSPPQLPSAHFPAPPASSIPRLASTDYSPFDTPFGCQRGSIMPYTPSPFGAGNNLNNTWLDPYSICGGYNLSGPSFLGPNSSLPRIDETPNAELNLPLSNPHASMDKISSVSKHDKKRTFDGMSHTGNDNEKPAQYPALYHPENLPPRVSDLSGSNFHSCSLNNEGLLPELQTFHDPATASSESQNRGPVQPQGNLANCRDQSADRSVFTSREPSQEAEQPPMKRARTETVVEPKRKGSGFVKYAATAFVGATIGAVGTVLGLAALPVDFFA